MTLPPRRLLDDPEVSAQLRTDLQEAAAFGGPSFELGRALDRFERATLDARAPRTRRRWVAFAAGAATLGAVTLAAATVMLGGYLSPPDHEAPSQAPIEDGAPPSRLLSPHAPPTSIPEPAAQRPSEPAGDARALRAATSAPRRSASVPATSRSPEQRAVLLEREVAQLAELRAALGSDPARAVELANTGHREFAGGALYVEREALAISALSRLGRVAEARARGDRLAHAFPRHPYVEQVRRQTGARSEAPR